eukprot:g5911.t1
MEPRRFSAGAITKKSQKGTKFQNQIPIELVQNEELQRCIRVLPSNYNFEILKTVWRLKQAKAKSVALQFPEGLLMYSLIISDILKRFSDITNCFVLGDVTYGACCIDDFTARALECDFLVHYGHSCLVPVDVTSVLCLYVFVTIEINMDHFVETMKQNFTPMTHLALAGTIQFSPAVHGAKEELMKFFKAITVPQIRPLSPGEVLGCTAPKLSQSIDALVFIADGRFHLEAIMIANPGVPAFRYDPYNTVLTHEEFWHQKMRKQRTESIKKASTATKWGIVLGALGRQGNPAIVEKLNRLLIESKRQIFNFVMSEILPDKINRIRGVEAWVQVGCPRLSIDWGSGFDKPVLTPYEAMVAMNSAPGFWMDENEEGDYPMDYYAKDGGPWSSSYHKTKSSKRSMKLTQTQSNM